MLTPIEAALVAKVKETQDSDALTKLADMHTGIYYDIIGRYAKSYPDVIKRADLSDERLYHIYQFVLAYKDDRNMKLSSYIGERTDYLCKSLLRREEHNPLSTTVVSGDYDGASMLSFPSSPYDQSSAIQSPKGQAVALVDETAAARPAEAAEKEIGIEDILRVVEDPDIQFDHRFEEILKLRHFESPPWTWRKIGPKFGVTYEMARKIYKAGMKKVQAHMKEGIT